MADYIVKDTELTSVANAIRTAGGTNSLLNFPNGFVSAVNNISGGSSDFSMATVTITNSTSSSIMQSCVNILEFVGEQAMTTELPPIGANQSITCDMVLFKGTQIIYAPDDVYINVTGDITEEEEGVIVIAGDGTIAYITK